MKQPTLVVLAAGMGSRFGGLKQMTPVDEQGNSILHYSIYDAIQAGFGKVVFVIKKAIEEDFRQITAGLEKHIDVAYAFQEVDMLPAGFQVPGERTKPWGTGHAVLCAKDEVDGPFTVINSDDFYGRGAYTAIADFLRQPHGEREYAMVGFLLKNALTENGSVARGVCQADENGFLTSIVERTKVIKGNPNPKFSLDEGATWQELSPDTLVSMNLWGFHRSFLDESIEGFPGFLENAMANNPTKAEYFIPLVVERLLSEKKAAVRVLSSTDKWYGVTYKEDKPSVVEAIRRMTESGLYPDQLWV